MTDVRRYYKCGCCPDDEQFCKIGNFLVWVGRESAQEWGMEDNILPHRAKMLKRMDAESSYLMGVHLGHQRENGDCRDVDFDAPEMQEPDDGYDEDPS